MNTYRTYSLRYVYTKSVYPKGHYTRWRTCANHLVSMVQEVRNLFSDLNMFGLDSSRQGETNQPINNDILSQKIIF